MIKSYLSKININITYAFSIFLASFIFFEIVKYPTYTSEMLIGIKGEEDRTSETPRFNLDFASPTITNETNDLYRVKELFESERMLQQKLELINLIGFKKFFFNNFFVSEQDRLKESQLIVVKDKSATLSISTQANTKEGAFLLNMINIKMLSDYFDLKKSINSEIKIAKSLCKLDINSLELRNIKNADFDSLKNYEDILASNSGIDMITKRIEGQKIRCLEDFNINEKIEVSEKNISIPKLNINQVVNRSKNESTNEVITDLIERDFISDRVEIISDASKPSKRDDPRSIIYSIVLVFVFFMIRFFSKIFLRLINYSE